MGLVLTSGSLRGVMVRTMGWGTRDVGSIPALGTIFPIFITGMPCVSHSERSAEVQFIGL